MRAAYLPSVAFKAPGTVPPTWAPAWATCADCDGWIPPDLEADGDQLCGSCRWSHEQIVPLPIEWPVAEEPIVVWDAAWDTEPVPDPPPKTWGPGRPPIYPQQTFVDRFRCPVCDSANTSSGGTGSDGRIGYRDCLACGRYSFPRPEPEPIGLVPS